MLSIVQIGPYPVDVSIIQGGMESSVYGLARELSKINKVTIFDIPRFDSTDMIEQLESMKICRFHNPGNHVKDAVQRIPDYVRQVRSLKPDICHIHGTSVFNWKLFKQLRKAEIPIFLTVHGLVKVEKRKILQRHFSFKTLYQYVVQSHAERQLLQSVSKIIVDTGYVKKAMLGYGLRHTPSIHVIPQGIQDRYFNIECSDSSKMILSVGTFSRRKGQLLMVKAFEKIAYQMPETVLVLCGTVAEVGYYKEVVAYIATSSFKERVTIKTNLSRDELDNQYRRANLFALYSSEESQGIALIEAMAAGLPVVATRVGGIPDVVADGESGILADYDDLDSFSKALLQLLSDNVKWNIMSQNSKMLAKKYSWHTITQSIQDYYTN